MKKLLSLLSVLTISGTAVPIIIAASPYQKEEIKLESNLKRVKRAKYNIINLNNTIPTNITVNRSTSRFGITGNNDPSLQEIRQAVINYSRTIRDIIPINCINALYISKNQATISIHYTENYSTYKVNKVVYF